MQTVRALLGPHVCPSCNTELYSVVATGLSVQAVHTKAQLDLSKEKIVRVLDETGAPQDVKDRMKEMWKAPEYVITPSMADEIAKELQETFPTSLTPKTDEPDHKADSTH